MKEIHIDAQSAGMRLDKYLFKRFPNLKASAMHKGLRNKKIKVNRQRAQANQRLEQGDILLLFLPPDLLEENQIEIPKSAKDLQVLKENGDVLALFKPAGVLSQKDEAGDQETINERLQAYLYDPQNSGSVFTPAVLGRLDRNTSGIMLAGKNPKAAAALSAALAGHQIFKHYLALTDGIPEEGEIILYMKKEGTKALVSPDEKEGYQKAVMKLEVLDKDPDKKMALCRIDLITGRFHQIRACLAYLGTPVIADAKYGKAVAGYSQQLQAYCLDDSQAGLLNPLGKVELPKEMQISLHPLKMVKPEDF